jgi:transcription initiation factor IIF auxiliary subunit
MKLMQNEPMIQARLILNNEGKPEIVGWRSYKIELSVKGVPEDTFAVTYFLHETYYDPVRESHDQKSNFSEELTSYGDFEIKAKIRAKSSSILISRQLSDALQETHGSSNDFDIKEALQKIAAN